MLLPAVAAPIVAGLASMLATRFSYGIGDTADGEATRKGYRAGQIASAGLVSLAHGTNDAQKTMGIITLALVAGGSPRPRLQPLPPGWSSRPVWPSRSAPTSAAGASSAPWARGLTDLEPRQGFAAQSSAATAILASSHLGFSLSTTHVVSGSVMGAGLGRKGGVVRWSTATRMFAAWALTLPAAALVGAGAEAVTDLGDWGTAAVAVFLVASSAAIWKISRREVVDHTNVIAEPDEPAGVVTTAIAAVTPPPAGTVTEDLTATIPRPGRRAGLRRPGRPAGRHGLTPSTRLLKEASP